MLTENQVITEVCDYLRNDFDRWMPRYYGDFTIEDGQILGLPQPIYAGQYIRIIGSPRNDGVWRWPVQELADETFTGTVKVMAVPAALVAICQEIKDWRDKYEAVDSEAMSPFSSESFGGYSYSKYSTGNGESGGGTSADWKSAFAPRLSAWRKI